MLNSQNCKPGFVPCLSAITFKGLKRHLNGTSRRPPMPILINSAYFAADRTTLLTDDEVEDMFEAYNIWEQKEATVRHILYSTVSVSVFQEIKNEPSAALVWDKLVSIFESKGELLQSNILTKLQTITCAEGANVRDHIALMQTMREDLANMGTKITDEAHATNIKRSLPSNFRPFLSTLSTSCRLTKATIALNDLVAMIFSDIEEQESQAAKQTLSSQTSKSKSENSVLAAKGEGSS